MVLIHATDSITGLRVVFLACSIYCLREAAEKSSQRGAEVVNSDGFVWGVRESLDELLRQIPGVE